MLSLLCYLCAFPNLVCIVPLSPSLSIHFVSLSFANAPRLIVPNAIDCSNHSLWFIFILTNGPHFKEHNKTTKLKKKTCKADHRRLHNRTARSIQQWMRCYSFAFIVAAAHLQWERMPRVFGCAFILQTYRTWPIRWSFLLSATDQWQQLHHHWMRFNWFQCEGSNAVNKII